MDGYEDFGGPAFDRPFEGVLRITLDAPGINAVDAHTHREPADDRLAVDRDTSG